MRFGICASVENARAVKEAGYDYVELTVLDALRPLDADDPTPAISRKLDEAGISCESMNILLPGSLKVTGPEVNREKLLSYMRTVGERAERLGVKTLVFGSGGSRGVPDGFSFEKAKVQILWFLKAAGDILGTHKITLALEPLDKWDSNIIQLVSEGACYVREVRHPAVRLLADSYHMDVEKEPWTDLLGVGDILAHVHISEPDRKVPGTTDYDFTPFFTNLKKAGYKGRVSIEAEWNNVPEQARKAMPILRQGEGTPL
jgi:sugar phosphate isomerase/epimerase